MIGRQYILTVSQTTESGLTAISVQFAIKHNPNKQQKFEALLTSALKLLESVHNHRLQLLSNNSQRCRTKTKNVMSARSQRAN